MSAASPFLAAHDAPQHMSPPDIPDGSRDANLWEFAELCLAQTAEALHEVRAATPAQLNQGIAATRELHASEKPSDLLEVIARIQGHDEERLGAAIMELSNKISTIQSPYPPVAPFGGKLIAPSAFYDSFDQIHKIARVLLSPVIYAEDTDAIGTASVNPIASAILAEEIRNAVHRRFGIRPFVTVARLDYENWSFLARKHFEL